MSIPKIEYIKVASAAALKEKDKVARQVLCDLLAAIKKEAIDKKIKESDITDELVDRVVLREQKVLKEMIETCPYGREDLLLQYEQKKKIIDQYAPYIETDETKIENMIISYCLDNNIEFIKKSNKKTIMLYLKGKVDMRIANMILGRLLK